MKKLIIFIIAIAMMAPMMADAKKKKKDEVPQQKTYDNPYCKITYTTPPWKLQPMKMPTAGSMAADTAAQSSTQRFGGVEVARPEGWVSGREIGSQAIDAAIGTATDTAAAGIGGAIIESKIKKMMPKFAMATFKRENPAVDIMVTIMESSTATTGMEQPVSQKGKGKAESSCQVLEQGKTTWGGRKATLMTTRCPLDNKEYQWSSMVSMRKGDMNYMMNATYVSSTSDISDFNSIVKSGMDMILNGTTFK